MTYKDLAVGDWFVYADKKFSQETFMKVQDDKVIVLASPNSMRIGYKLNLGFPNKKVNFVSSFTIPNDVLECFACSRTSFFIKAYQVNLALPEWITIWNEAGKTAESFMANLVNCKEFGIFETITMEFPEDNGKTIYEILGI